MSTLRKNILAWLGIMVFGVLFIALALYVSIWFAIPFLAIVAGSNLVLQKIVCPNCGMPVTYQGESRGVGIFGGFIRRKCQNCGWDLGK